MQLDIVDLESPLEQQIETMGRACETNGFFRIPLSLIRSPMANNAWWMTAEFFALAPNEKQHVAFPEPGYPYGYAAMQTEALARFSENALLVEAPAGQHDLKDDGHQRFPFLWGWIRTRQLCGHHRLQGFRVERAGETFGLFLSCAIGDHRIDHQLIHVDTVKE
jgi:hypothetical protein